MRHFEQFDMDGNRYYMSRIIGNNFMYSFERTATYFPKFIDLQTEPVK